MRKKKKPEVEDTKWTPVEGEAEPAEGTVGPAETVAVDLDEFEPHRKPKGLGVTDVAKEVIAGNWGTGQDRRLRLSEAGYDAKEVEDEVVRLLNS